MKLARLTGTLAILLLAVAACSAPAATQQSEPGSPTIAGAATPMPTSMAHESEAGGSATAITVQALDSAFNVTTIEAPANSTFSVTLENLGELPHDIAFYDEEGGSPLSEESVSAILQGGQTATITFTTPGPGTYFFVCLVHPQEMTGTFVVK